MPVVADHTAVKCPELEARDKAVFRERVARPKSWDTSGASKGALLGQIDKLEDKVEKMGATGVRVVDDYERCRDAPSPTS